MIVPMVRDPDNWQRVGRAIAERIEDVPLSKAEVIRASGVSGKTLDGYIAGNPIKRIDKERDLCRALGWGPDSIARIRRGDSPSLLADWEPPVPNHVPKDLEAITSELHRLIDELARRAQGQ